MPSESTLRIPSLLELAAVQHARGELDAATRSYEQVLALDARQALALAGLGAIAGQRGDARQAVRYLGEASRIDDRDARIHHNLAEALHQLGQNTQAVAAWHRALERDPRLTRAWDSLIAHTQAALARAQQTRDATATATLTRELASLCNNLGNAWLGHGQAAQAVPHYRRAITLHADYGLAWSNLGNALRDVHQISEAHAATLKATQLAPELPEAWNNLGNCFTDLGRFGEADACYARALELRPDFAQARHNRGSGSLFNRLYDPQATRASIAALHAAWGAAHAAPATPRQWPNSRAPQRVLRVGYLSADFREHAMLRFIEPLLARHDTRAVELVCYAQGPIADAQTRRLVAYGHRWIWTHGMDDAELAARIEADQIDILVDCMGHTHGTRIEALARKSAPILMSWLGYLCDSGLSALDHRLSDAWVDPPEAVLPPDEHAAVLRVPGGMMAWRGYVEAPEPAAQPPCLRNGFVTFGSLNNTRKINREVVRVWAQLLHAVPDARLLLQSKLLADAGVVGRLQGLFEAFDIAPGRLLLRPASTDWLRSYDAIDVALDTFPYGGGATTCDALWMGVPVVSLAGDRPWGRLSCSILQRTGCSGWIATDTEHYARLAQGLAADPGTLTQLRGTLRARMKASALCDEAGFVRALEDVYRNAWRAWLARTV